MGDWSVAKNAVTSGSDCTLRRRSGWRKRRSSTIVTAKRRPMSMRMSRARRAGNTLTRARVTTAPAAVGITTKGRTVKAATA